MPPHYFPPSLPTAQVNAHPLPTSPLVGPLTLWRHLSSVRFFLPSFSNRRRARSPRILSIEWCRTSERSLCPSNSNCSRGTWGCTLTRRCRRRWVRPSVSCTTTTTLRFDVKSKPQKPLKQHTPALPHALLALLHTRLKSAVHAAPAGSSRHQSRGFCDRTTRC